MAGSLHVSTLSESMAMKRAAVFLMLVSLFLLPGCGGGDAGKDKNKGQDRPVPDKPAEKK